MKIIVSNIDWDYPEKGTEESGPDLPSQVIIEDPPPHMLEDIHGEACAVAEYLSETYGYCVCGFSVDVEDGGGRHD